MSFWNTSTGDNAAQNATTEYDAGGGFDLIPDKSTVHAYVNNAEWKQDQNFNNYINLTWCVSKPESLAGRKWFQKLWVDDPNPQWKPGEGDKKRDKALSMLAAIDLNCGGKLAKKGTKPTDDELMLALCNKPMGCHVRVWDMNGNEGNWTAAVMPAKTTEVKLGEDKAPASGGGGRSISDDLDEHIPF